MSHPFRHPASGILIERVAQAFTADNVYLETNRNLLFVCGGAVAPKRRSLRKKFLNYAATELPNFRVFLAESATKDIFDYSDPNFLNLAKFENFIAEFADCILIFPESPGSLAEIGFFSAYERLRKKLLVANKVALQAVDSFINNGPLALVNADSEFRPVIQIDDRQKEIDFSPIKQRLGRFPSVRRQRFSFSEYSALIPKSRLAVILELVRVFGPISLHDLHSVVNAVFGTVEMSDVKHILSLLVAVQYLDRVGNLEDRFVSRLNARSLLALNGSEIDRVRLSVVDFYQRFFPEIYRLVGTVSQ